MTSALKQSNGNKKHCSNLFPLCPYSHTEGPTHRLEIIRAPNLHAPQAHTHLTILWNFARKHHRHTIDEGLHKKNTAAPKSHKLYEMGQPRCTNFDIKIRVSPAREYYKQMAYKMTMIDDDCGEE